MNKTKNTLAAAVLLASLAAAAPANAVEFDLSGFASLVAGRTYGPCTPDNALATRFATSCTRFVADWGHGSVYHNAWSITPESRAGLQGTAKFDPQWSVTAQVVARTVNQPLAQLEWGYVTWKPTPEWTLQAGRKRLPLFYYSDFQDVGYAYPWVRVPPDVYGWDMVNYDGASAAYSTQLGGWSLRTSAFGGTAKSRRNGYMKIFYDQEEDVKWPGLWGADFEFSRDWFTGRLVYMRAGYEEIDRDSATRVVQPSGATSGHHQAYGGSVNIDWHNFLVRSEYSIFDRSQYAYKAVEWFVSAGYRIGKFTPMLTFTQYRESTPFPDTYDPSHWYTHSLSLRYELTESSALKVQFDRIRDVGTVPFMGNAKVLSTSLDVVF
jgi:hypothetical protein